MTERELLFKRWKGYAAMVNICGSILQNEMKISDADLKKWVDFLKGSDKVRDRLIVETHDYLTKEVENGTSV